MAASRPPFGPYHTNAIRARRIESLLNRVRPAAGRPHSWSPPHAHHGSRTRSPSSPPAQNAASWSTAPRSSNAFPMAAPEGALAGDVRRLPPCRPAGAGQRASPFLPDADPRPSGGRRQGPPRLARGDGARVGPDDARGASGRRPHGAGRASALGLHDDGGPSQSLSAGARGGDRHRGGGSGGARGQDDGHARLDGHFREGRRPAARIRSSRAPTRSSPTASGFWRAITTRSAGALLRVALAPCSPLAVPQRVLVEFGGARRALRRRPALPPLPVAGRGRLRDGDLRQALGRSARGRGLADAPHLGRARHPFQRRRDRAGSVMPASRSATCPRPTWPSASESARRANSRRRASRSGSASTARPRTIPRT